MRPLATLSALILLSLSAGCAYQPPQPVVSFNAHPSSLHAVEGFELQPGIELQLVVHEGDRTLQLAYLNNQDLEVQVESLQIRPDAAKGKCSLFLTNRINVPAETTARVPLLPVADVEDCAGPSRAMMAGRRLHSVSASFQAPGSAYRGVPVEVMLRSREREDPGGWSWSSTETFYFWYPRS
jgi:hypothetical protein